MEDAKRCGLLASFQQTLERRQAHSARRSLSISPAAAVDLSSNDFLSLAASTELRQAFREELDAQQGLPLGSGGSRLLDGNSLYAERLEQDIAAFHGAPAGLLFNSGFDANTGIFACVPQPGDVVLHDEYVHASVHEGMRLSRAGVTRAFAHNSVGDLEAVLAELMCQDLMLKDGRRNVFVAVESVYSMDGDVAPLVAILDLLDRLCPQGNGHVIVDEAHSTGVFGLHGRGLVCELGVEHRVLARLHTFGKALSANGAIVLCPPAMRDYLVNYARSLIYTTAMSLPSLALVRAVYRLLWSGRTAARQARLWHLTRLLHTRLHQVLLPLIADKQILTLAAEVPRSPIFSLQTPRPRDLARFCQRRDLTVRAIVPPTVPEGLERVRVCLHSGNGEGEVERLVEAVRAWAVQTLSDEEREAAEEPRQQQVPHQHDKQAQLEQQRLAQQQRHLQHEQAKL